ncbi:hypothetical protein [Microbacterium sp.]|uniref:hypothetical protein n=1 Tax=Microbacterium sp. TaxID=51671 RepID=UPI003F6EB79C
MAGTVKGYRVIGAAAVIRKNGHERYVAHDGVFTADQLDDDNAKHLLSVGLIEVIKVEAPAKTGGSTITEADVAAAVKAAEAAKDAELADGRKAVEEEAQEVAAAKAELEQAQQQLEADRAELATALADATKPTAAKAAAAK